MAEKRTSSFIGQRAVCGNYFALRTKEDCFTVWNSNVFFLTYKT